MSNTWEMTVDIRSDAIDRGQVLRALGLIVDPDSTHEIRVLPMGASRIFHGNNLDEAINFIEERNQGSTGIYVTMNPAESTHDATCKDKHIIARKRFLVDCDRRANKSSNANEEEKEAARLVMESVLADLTQRGWPRPIVIDSGNGWHLLYAIDLPSDNLSKATIKKCLKVLDNTYGTENAEVDTSTFNASRITKVPGTWARKGPPVNGRPYRMARLVSVPAVFSPVEFEQLQALAGTGEATPANEPEDETLLVANVWEIPIAKAGTGGAEAYVRKALELEFEKVLGAREGDRNNVLNIAAFSLGTLLHLDLVGRIEIEQALTNAAVGAGLGVVETERTIRSGLNAGALEPRQIPEREKGKKANDEQRAAVIADPQNLIVWASKIKPKKVDWLWKGRIPIGKMTTFAGPGGIGKSFVLCDIASRISAGLEWPFNGGETAKQGNVLFISGEDDEDDTLVPRLIECGADLDHIAFLGEKIHDAFSLTDLGALSAIVERMVVERNGDVQLVIIDPPTGYLDDTDSHKDSELRSRLFGPMKRWVAKYQTALIFNLHVNKGMTGNVDAASRVMGSVAWVNAVRTAHMFIRDKDDEEKVLFVPFKVNIGKRRKGLIYRIAETRDDLAKIEWLAEADTTADEALGKEAKKPAAKDARAWVIDMFKRMPEWPSDLWWAELKSGGITEHRFNQVRAALDIPKSRRVAGPTGDVSWIWWVPPDWPPFSETE